MPTTAKKVLWIVGVALATLYGLRWTPEKFRAQFRV